MVKPGLSTSHQKAGAFVFIGGKLGQLGPQNQKIKAAVGIENDSYSHLGLQRCACEILCPKGQPTVLSCPGKH